MSERADRGRRRCVEGAMRAPRSCRSRSIALVTTLATALLAGHAAPAAADRLAPYTIRQAVLGCWDVGAGATLTLAPFGRHSVIATARFRDRPRGGPARIREDGRWVEAEQAFAVPCRPRSQHGSVCLVRPVDAGLEVRVVAYGAGGKVDGVVETVVAQRCH